MRWLLVLLVLGCGGSPFEKVDCDEPIEMELFPVGEDGARDDRSPLPYRNGGEIDLEVRVSSCEFSGSAMAHAYVASELIEVPDAGVRFGQSVTLTPVSDGEGESLRGRVTLRAPRGGSVLVGAEAIGATKARTLELVVPTIGRTAAPVLRRTASGVEVSVCVDTSVAEGALSIQRLDSTTSKTAQSRQGSCADPSDTSARRFEFDLTSTEAEIPYRATLEGTSLRYEETLSTVPAATDRTVVPTFSDPSIEGGVLPPAGRSIQLEVQVDDARGMPMVGEAVTVVASGASITVIPDPLKTNELGTATAFFPAPTENELALVVSSGSTTADPILLRREAPALEIRFASGTPEASGVLPSAGVVIPVDVLVTRGGANVEGETFTVTTQPASVTSSVVPSDATGVASFEVVAPTEGQLTIEAKLGAAQDFAVLRRPSTADASLAISFATGSPAEAGMLPAVSTILPMVVTATRGGSPAAGTTVTFDSLPSVMVSPMMGSTGADGTIRFNLLVPDVPELLLRVSTGAETDEVVLSR